MTTNQQYEYAIQVTTNVGLKCHICETESFEMRELVPLDDPHKDMTPVCSSARCIAYVCEECPCVMLEYYTSKQTEALEKLLNYNTQKALVIMNPHNEEDQSEGAALTLRLKSKSVSGYILHSPRMHPSYVREIGEIVYEGETSDGNHFEAIFKTGLENIFGNSHKFSPSVGYSCEVFKLNKGVMIKPNLITPDSSLYPAYKDIIEAIEEIEMSSQLDYNRSVEAYEFYLENHNNTYTYAELVNSGLIHSHILIKAKLITQ